MKLRVFFKVLLPILFIAGMAWADQIVMKDGTEYSGKFIRGDANTIEFRILGRVENFKTSDVARIIFKEPELVSAPEVKGAAAPDAEKSAPAAQESITPAQGAPSGPPAQQSAQPDASSVTIPAGTQLTIRTTVAIDTDRNRVGDVFDAILDEPVSVGNQIVVPRGAEVKGDIAYAKESGRLSGQSQLILELKELKVNGKPYVIRTSDYTEVGSSRGKRTAAAAGGGAALGAIIGAIAGGGKGAAIGAATGGAVGTGTQVLTKGQTLKVPAETILAFTLQSPVTVALQ